MSISQHKKKKRETVGLIKETQSVCPVCLKPLPAKIVEENNKVFLEKTCSAHGFFKELYWSDAKLFKKFDEFARMGVTPENPNTKIKNECPFDCGLCEAHESQTLLAIIDVTNRCNLKCSYCFANSAASGYLYEPSFEEIEKMMDLLRAEKPFPALAIQFSGGEPLLRNDIVDLVKKAKEKGFAQIFIATNGIQITKNLELAKQLREAGVTTLYLKFNGITPITNTENYNFIPQIFENCRKAGLQLSLVPTIIKGFNDHEAYSIIELALKNLDIVRVVNFQPISFCGRMDAKEREQKRFTIPDLISALDKQSNGTIPKNAFYPIPTVVPLSELAERLINKKQVLFSAHPHCGAATYLFKDDEKIIPITDFVNITNLIEQINKLSKENPKGLTKKVVTVNKLRKILKENITQETAPKYLNLKKLLLELLTGNFDTLLEFHLKTLFIGVMHFQDPYNFDIDRVKKCVIHFATPDGKIIPFCTYNNLGYREKIEKAHSKKVKSGNLK